MLKNTIRVNLSKKGISNSSELHLTILIPSGKITWNKVSDLIEHSLILKADNFCLTFAGSCSLMN